MQVFSVAPPVTYILIYVIDRIRKFLKVGHFISFGINKVLIILINLISETMDLLK